MSRIVQARIDRTTERLLARLRRVTGANDSELVRRGLAALHATLPQSPKRRIVGLGKFSSGIRDLGSNDEHLRGFGKS